MFGGGIKDTLLCKMTASACGVPVYAGPVEATVMGNIGVACLALGEIRDHKEAGKSSGSPTILRFTSLSSGRNGRRPTGDFF